MWARLRQTAPRNTQIWWGWGPHYRAGGGEVRHGPLVETMPGGGRWDGERVKNAVAKKVKEIYFTSEDLKLAPSGPGRSPQRRSPRAKARFLRIWPGTPHAAVEGPRQGGSISYRLSCARPSTEEGVYHRLGCVEGASKADGYEDHCAHIFHELQTPNYLICLSDSCETTGHLVRGRANGVLSEAMTSA